MSWWSMCKLACRKFQVQSPTLPVEGTVKEHGQAMKVTVMLSRECSALGLLGLDMATRSFKGSSGFFKGLRRGFQMRAGR